MKEINGNKYLDLKELNKILAYDKAVNLWITNRGGGKTTTAIEYAVKRFEEQGYKFVIIQEQVNTKDNVKATLFKGIEARGYFGYTVEGNVIYKYSINKDGKKEKVKAGVYAALSEYKQFFGYGDRTHMTIVVDEFLRFGSDSMYKLNELWMSLAQFSMSSNAADFRIIMISNPINYSNEILYKLGIFNIEKGFNVSPEGEEWVLYFDDSTIKGNKELNNDILYRINKVHNKEYLDYSHNNNFIESFNNIDEIGVELIFNTNDISFVIQINTRLVAVVKLEGNYYIRTIVEKDYDINKKVSLKRTSLQESVIYSPVIKKELEIAMFNNRIYYRTSYVRNILLEEIIGSKTKFIAS